MVMMKRVAIVFVTALLLVQGIFAGKAGAASSFTDIKGHWAQQQISELASLGIIKDNGKHLFYPQSPITRGEALAMLNRVFEHVYGPVAKPLRKNNLDYRYPSRWEIEQLLTNMKAMLQIETGVPIDYDPGDRMLYYLHIAESGQLIKKPEKENPDWWLSSQALQREMTREEATMVLFHLLTPQIYRTANIKPQDAPAFFTSYYEWKQESYYRDTYSPYATAIREFHLFSSQTTLQPDKLMTRAEYAVVLKRLLDYYSKQVGLQFTGKAEQSQKVATAFIRAANLAGEKKDKAKMLYYYTQGAVASMGKLPRTPLTDDLVSVTTKVDETDNRKLWAIAEYKTGLNSGYRIEYRMDPDATTPFGRKIAAVIYSQ